MVLLFGTIIYFTPGVISISISVVILVGSALFMVRSYTVSGKQLVIHRPGWTTEYDINQLKEITINRNVISGSWRMFGIGGLFGYIGSFRNDELGNFKAYATHRHNCVVLKFSTQTIVVTPDTPESFAQAVQSVREESG